MTAAPPLAAAVRLCPECGAEIPIHPNCVTWCERCDWNVRPHHKPAEGWLARFYERLGRRLSRRLFEQVSRLPVVKPAFSISQGLLLLAAAAIHSVTLLLVAAGAWLLIGGWPHVMLVALALVVLAIAWVSRPRLASMPEDILPRASYPALYGLADRIAAALGAPKLDALASEPFFNATFNHVGLRRRSVIEIGAPLFAILTPQERVALLGHELAHGVNGDPLRGWFVHSATYSLWSWAELIRPDALWQPQGEGLIPALASLLMIPVNLVLLALSQLIIWAAQGMIALAYRTSQRAEYLADYLAATVGGTEAMLSLLEKMYLDRSVAVAVQRVSLTGGKDSVFAAIREQVGKLPARELERLRRLSLREEARIDMTHPPTSYRVAFMRQHAIGAPKVALSEAEIERIEAELRALEAAAQPRMLDAHKQGLYA